MDSETADHRRTYDSATRLIDKRILVVGAGTRPSDETDALVGNGRAIAVRAAREGAVVACLDKRPEAAEETAAFIRAEGGRATVVVADVSDPGETERAVLEVISVVERLDGVVLNVGLGYGTRLADTSLAQWERTFAVSARSHFLVTKLVDPHLTTRASLVFVSSIAAGRSFSDLPAYDSAKASIEVLCRHVARELGPRGIRANAVRVGLIDTPVGRLGAAARSGRELQVPLENRRGSSWEVASVVAFLLSSDASYVSGQTIAVDGGVSTSLIP